MKLVVRSIEPGDLNLVLDTYLKSWRANKHSGTIPNHLFVATQRALFEGLIGRGAKVYVCGPAGTDTVLGWALAEEKEGKCIIHYMWVRDAFLTKGIDVLLLNAIPGDKPGFITHNQGLPRFRGYRWVPEIARRKSL